MKEYKKALYYFNLSINNKHLRKLSPNDYVISLINIAYAKHGLKDYSQLPDLYLESLKLSDSLNLKSQIVVNKFHLSEYYAEQKDTAKARKFINEALLLAKSYKSPVDVKDCLVQVIKINPYNASKPAQEYIRITDSLQLAERLFRNKFARIAYETDEIT